MKRLGKLGWGGWYQPLLYALRFFCNTNLYKHRNWHTLHNLTGKMEVACTSETLVTSLTLTWCDNPRLEL